MGEKEEEHTEDEQEALIKRVGVLIQKWDAHERQEDRHDADGVEFELFNIFIMIGKHIKNWNNIKTER